MKLNYFGQTFWILPTVKHLIAVFYEILFCSSTVQSVVDLSYFSVLIFFVSHFRGASPADKYGDAHTTAMEALEGFVIGLYSDCFNAIVSLVNR